MNIRIYRGTHEIGGTCIEIQSSNNKSLWVDLGSPLSDPNPNITYVAAKSPDAVLISHPHQDHFGLIEKLNNGTPIYIGQVSLDLINATKIFMGNPLYAQDFHLFKPWKTFTIQNTFTIIPLLVDHSSPEAFAFIIEADGKRIFYTGDFRVLTSA